MLKRQFQLSNSVHKMLKQQGSYKVIFPLNKISLYCVVTDEQSSFVHAGVKMCGLTGGSGPMSNLSKQFFRSQFVKYTHWYQNFCKPILLLRGAQNTT